ncbi:MAG: TIGR01212 family radical SAM protein [Epulopiscium sp. Nuni2H_MBin003]|nr:MAG: TIGR01212 family radical SAM protein [Epulopiscium sp. Nuni2H_MBin003]
MYHRKHFHLNEYLRERHGEKVIKLSLDGGFSCPNRDGTLSYGGCIFCNSHGSGDFAGDRRLDIQSQINSQISLLQNKWPRVKKYIAYFGAYSNTYAPLSVLQQKYETALAVENVVGLAIATRPDCLPIPTLEYLHLLNDTTHLWVELGLQTIHSNSATWINRGFSLEQFNIAVSELHKRNIEIVVHIIVGLPNESIHDIIETAKYLSQLPITGIKIHMLHILKNSPLAKQYNDNPFYIFTEEEYINIVSEILNVLPPNIIIHRLTGDGAKENLIAPLWTLNKKRVLNNLHKSLNF